eukprot:516305-Pyramimonas_sp.AAC.1
MRAENEPLPVKTKRGARNTNWGDRAREGGASDGRERAKLEVQAVPYWACRARNALYTNRGRSP